MRPATRLLLLVLLSGTVLLSCLEEASGRHAVWSGRTLQQSHVDTTHGSVAYVANSSDPAAAGIKQHTVTLRQALEDPKVTAIILLTNYTAGDEFDHHTDEYPSLKVNRNVTMTSQPGVMPVLDFRFMRSVVHLCATCLFEMHDMAISNERRGNGGSIDFFVGDPGSVLQLRNGYRLRLACTSTDSTLELINRDQKRSARFPSPRPNHPDEQWLDRNNVTFQGHSYIDMVELVEYGYDVAQSFQEGKGIVGGFTMRTINTTRLCLTTVNASCLKVKGPDACVNEAIDLLLAQQDGHTAGAQESGAPQGASWLVAVVVPVCVVAGLLVVSTLILWVLCARHRKRQQQALEHAKLKEPNPGCDGAGSSKQLIRGSASSGSRDRALLDSEEGCVDSFLDGDLGEARWDQGWEVVAMNTSPSVGSVGNCKIHFGPLLGSGSFGRVYKGRWAGREVAIKCIEHDSDTSKAVENEVVLMLSLDHDNIVKAYHYITYRHAIKIPSDSPAASDAARRSSSGCGTGSGTARRAAPAEQQGSSAIPANPISKRQRREQVKQLQQVQRQLEQELGPQHQWLLDMHLGFIGQQQVGCDFSTGSAVSYEVSSASSREPVAGGSSSSLPVTSSVLTPAQASCDLSSIDISDGVLCVDPSRSNSSISAVQGDQGSFSSVPASRAQQGSKQPQPPDGLQQLRQQGLQTLPSVGEQQLQQHGVGSDGDEHQQQQPLTQQQVQQGLLPVSYADEQQHKQQLQQQEVEEAEQQQQHPPCQGSLGPSSRPAAAASLNEGVSRSRSSEGSGSLQNSSEHTPGPGQIGSASSHPSTGQALTPNQRVQLQRYLQRQQHLLHTSGMRSRPSAALPPLPNGTVGSANDSSNGGAEASSSAGRTPRRGQELARSRTYIVQEFCDLGTLTSYATKTLSDPTDDEQMLQLLVLLRDAAKGIAALHSKSVVHGDVNARNVLVCSSTTAPYAAVAKLADLGLSRVIRQQATHKTTNTVGTLSHMPPELLRLGHISPAVDIYSFGIMMWEVFTAQPAFRHLHYGQFFECIVMKNLRPNIPEDMPRDYSLLMLSCWATNPADRPTAEHLLELLQFMLQERQELMAHDAMYPSSTSSMGLRGGGVLGGAGRAECLSTPDKRGAAAARVQQYEAGGGLGLDASSSDGSSLHLQA